MTIEAPPGEQVIDLVFEKPLENRVGGWITLASLSLSMFLLVLPLGKKRT